MTPYDPNSHHRRSVRLPGYDYAQARAYFVTVCAKNRQCVFGRVVDGKMVLNEAGRMVKQEWLKTPAVRSHVELDEFVVMPNHFHGILMINDDCRGTARRAPTVEQFGKPVPGSLPTIIRAFKSAVTNRINAARGTSGTRVWQRGYFEHIVRDEESLNRIREYVVNNPAQWALDRENPDRVAFDAWLYQGA